MDKPRRYAPFAYRMRSGLFLLVLHSGLAQKQDPGREEGCTLEGPRYKTIVLFAHLFYAVTGHINPSHGTLPLRWALRT